MSLLFYSVSEGGGICDMSSPRLSIPDNWWEVSFVSILLISACTDNELVSIMGLSILLHVGMGGNGGLIVTDLVFTLYLTGLLSGLIPFFEFLNFPKVLVRNLGNFDAFVVILSFSVLKNFIFNL